MSSAKAVLGLLIVCLVAAAFYNVLYEVERPVPGKRPEPVKIPPKAERPFLVKASGEEFPDPYLFCKNREDVIGALEKNNTFLKKQDPQKGFLVGELKVSATDLLKTNTKLQGILNKCSALEPDAFRHFFMDSFEVLKLAGRQEIGDDRLGNSRRPMVVTGYFHPEMEASRVKNSLFKVPLYGIPRDLVAVSLRLFGQSLPARTIFGKVSGNKLLPYPTRCEIDYGPGLEAPPVLAYVKTEVDALTLHIQGSALLRLQNGEKRYIHYAASNGRPYRSVAKWLIKKGYLRPGQADWPGIKRWAKQHPDLFQRALCENPRYIFFKWEKEGPYGSMGVTLTPLVSVALDPRIYPLGLTGVLDTTIFTPRGKERFISLVANQDMGNAIRGPYRLDLYCGNGKAGERIAGRLKTPSRFFVVIARD